MNEKENKAQRILSGKRIQRRRKELEYTQTELADKIGVGASTISKYESGDIAPPIEQYIELGKVLKSEIGFLIALDAINGSGAKAEADELSREIINILERVSSSSNKKEWIDHLRGTLAVLKAAERNNDVRL